MPTAKLYGKDGPSGVNQLPITAQVDLHLQMNGETVTVPVFIQPDSTQNCLLGTNASIPLGLNLLMGKGSLSGLILTLIPILVLHRSRLLKRPLFLAERAVY